MMRITNLRFKIAKVLHCNQHHRLSICSAGLVFDYCFSVLYSGQRVSCCNDAIQGAQKDTKRQVGIKIATFVFSSGAKKKEDIKMPKIVEALIEKQQVMKRTIATSFGH